MAITGSTLGLFWRKICQNGFVDYYDGPLWSEAEADSMIDDINTLLGSTYDDTADWYRSLIDSYYEFDDLLTDIEFWYKLWFDTANKFLEVDHDHAYFQDLYYTINLYGVGS
jgi:hypothetical protein